MESKEAYDDEAGKQVEKATATANANQKGPLMILSSGKIVENILGKGKEQWKEIRDNNAKKGNTAGQTVTGSEIVTVEIEKEEHLPVENMATQKVETTNQFAILEVEEGQQDANNELALVAQSTASPTPNTTGKGKPKSSTKHTTPGKHLNVAAPAYNLATNEIMVLKAITQKEKEKESTSQWVNKAFGPNNVTTNHSYQETPSQSLDTKAIEEQENYQDRVKFMEGRLWNAQEEEHTEEEEDNLVNGKEKNDHIEEDVHYEEEYSVNANNDRVTTQQ